MNNMLLVLVAMITLMSDIQGAPGHYLVKLATHVELIPNGSRVLMQPSGNTQLVLVPSSTVKKPHGEDEAEENDEGIEESKDWEEEDKNTDEKESKEKEVDDGQYKKAYSEKDDPDEWGEEEHTKHNDDANTPEVYDKADEESEKLETKEEEVMHTEKGEEEEEAEEEDDSNDEEDESNSGREGKSNDNKDKGQYYIISIPREVAHKLLSQSEKKRNAPLVTAGTTKENFKTVPTSDITEKHEKDSAAIHPTKNEHSTAPELVIGSRDKAEVELSNSKGTSSEETPKIEEKKTSSDTKPNPPAKETEIVQLSPVIFHVSPKLVPNASVAIPGKEVQ